MRTTLDLPDDLLTEARRKAAEDGTTLTQLVSDGLRLRLRAQTVPPLPLLVSQRRGGLMPGIDPSSNSSLLDAADGLL